VWRIAFVACAILAALWILIDVAAAALFGQPPIVLWIITGFTGLILLPGVFAAARGARREVIASHVALRAGPWGIEAFARGYASARGMRLEDCEEFRRRFDAPLPGRPLKVLRASDDLRLVLWLSRFELPKQHWLLAIVPAREGPPPAVDGYVVAARSGALCVAVPVGDEGRSGAALDTLAGVARQLAAAPQTTSKS
jgi:hypothetical protein